MTQDTALLAVSEARQRLLQHFPRLGRIAVPLAQAVGRILAEDILAGFDLPPFPNSAVDGFALRAADVTGADAQHPVRLRVVDDIPAGRVSTGSLLPGQAMRIMTGAPIPDGADAVVMVEDTDAYQRPAAGSTSAAGSTPSGAHGQAGLEAPQWVSVQRALKPSDNLRPAGQDVRRGERVLAAGVRLRSQEIGLLSMLGVAQAPVYRAPRVAVFSSGDELLPAGQPLTPGKIYDANTGVLTSLVNQAGGEALDLGVAADRPDAVQALLDQAAAAGVDLILSSAGVSVGALDFVRSVVESRGRLDFWRVNMRPGKPLAFGEYQGVPFIGLPGNPVSAYIGYEVFVRPALLHMQGAARLFRPVWPAVLLEDIRSDGRESYLRAVVQRVEDAGFDGRAPDAAGSAGGAAGPAGPAGRLTVRLTGHQGSGNLRSLVEANALLFVPSGVKSLPSGSQVQVWLLELI